jgi:hypothetical protein
MMDRHTFDRLTVTEQTTSEELCSKLADSIAVAKMRRQLDTATSDDVLVDQFARQLEELGPDDFGPWPNDNDPED